MISLRRSRSSPLARFAACALVPAIVLVAIPIAAEPSLLGQNVSNPIQDELYRLTSDTVTIGALNQYSKGFTYDDVGNRQTQTTSIGPAGSVIPGVLVNGTQAYAYDERDRLLTETLGANPATAYTWDADGNLITKSGEATYAWDTEMRMVRATKTDGTIVEHVYDFDGNRVQTTTTPSGGSAATTNYLVDTSGSLSHVVAETNATGGLVAHYVRGDDLLAVMRPNGSGGWSSRFYHSDHIGSVRRLTDEAGTITDGYTYTAFGELLGHTGTDVQPYAFTGEPYDPNVAFQYHRARWMDPRVGRFAGMDPLLGQAQDPASLHRYQYAASTPLNMVDPTGKIASWLFAVAGTRVHQEIGIDFLLRGPERFANYVPIAAILGVNPTGCRPMAAFCALQPDLVDGVSNEVYEIKPLRSALLGRATLALYLYVMNANDPSGSVWTPGITYMPPRYLVLEGGWTAVVAPPVNGVITYEAFNLPATIAFMATLAVAAGILQGAAIGARAALQPAFGL